MLPYDMHLSSGFCVIFQRKINFMSSICECVTTVLQNDGKFVVLSASMTNKRQYTLLFYIKNSHFRVSCSICYNNNWTHFGYFSIDEIKNKNPHSQ